MKHAEELSAIIYLKMTMLLCSAKPGSGEREVNTCSELL